MDLDLAVDHLLPEANEDGEDDDIDLGFLSPHNRSSETDDTLDEIVDSDSEKDNFAKSSKFFFNLGKKRKYIHNGWVGTTKTPVALPR